MTIDTNPLCASYVAEYSATLQAFLVYHLVSLFIYLIYVLRLTYGYTIRQKTLIYACWDMKICTEICGLFSITEGSCIKLNIGHNSYIRCSAQSNSLYQHQTLGVASCVNATSTIYATSPRSLELRDVPFRKLIITVCQGSDYILNQCSLSVKPLLDLCFSWCTICCLLVLNFLLFQKQKLLGVQAVA